MIDIEEIDEIFTKFLHDIIDLVCSCLNEVDNDEKQKD